MKNNRKIEVGQVRAEDGDLNSLYVILEMGKYHNMCKVKRLKTNQYCNWYKHEIARNIVIM